MSSMAKNALCEDRKKRVKESFQLMDMDGDGYLDYHETKTALRALGLTVTKSYVVSIMRMYNKRGDDRISFDDFNFLALEKLNVQNPLDEARYVFKLFTEKSVNNTITLEDLKQITKKLDCNLTIEEMELMIQEFDLNHDNCIDEDEFIEIMTEAIV